MNAVPTPSSSLLCLCQWKMILLFQVEYAACLNIYHITTRCWIRPQSRSYKAILCLCTLPGNQILKTIITHIYMVTSVNMTCVLAMIYALHSVNINALTHRFKLNLNRVLFVPVFFIFYVANSFTILMHWKLFHMGLIPLAYIILH